MRYPDSPTHPVVIGFVVELDGIVELITIFELPVDTWL